MKTIYFEVQPADEGKRVDHFLSVMLQDMSRTYVQKVIKQDGVRVNDKSVPASCRLCAGDRVAVTVPDASVLEIEAEDIPLDIVYEDDDVILVNKPKGMVVHPAVGHYGGTLVNALMYHCKGNLSSINGIMRPGIVHRIDKDTTGILIVCKNNKAHNCIAEQLSEHSITRRYYAICHNAFSEEEGTVDAPIGRSPVDRKKMAVNDIHGKAAVTHYRVLENFSKHALIECRLETGRTHQIRVHMASIGHPVLGDEIYCNAKNEYGLTGQTLHAGVLGFKHPATGEYMEFSAPLPEYFRSLLDKFRNADKI